MYKTVVLSILLVLLAGCSSLSDRALQDRRSGIIDACYTTLEYSPADSKERINVYLSKQGAYITEQESKLILMCIERTERSKRWGK